MILWIYTIFSKLRIWYIFFISERGHFLRYYKISKEDFRKLMLKRQEEKKQQEQKIYYAYLNEQKGRKKPRRNIKRYYD